jgi:hypothetical protein
MSRGAARFEVTRSREIHLHDPAVLPAFGPAVTTTLAHQVLPSAEIVAEARFHERPGVWIQRLPRAPHDLGHRSRGFVAVGGMSTRLVTMEAQASGRRGSVAAITRSEIRSASRSYST